MLNNSANSYTLPTAVWVVFFSVILCSLAGHPRGEFAPRSSGGGIGWKRGGLAPPNPPADFRCGPAGLRVPTSPRGCGHRQAPGAPASARVHRQVPYAPYRLRCNNTRCKLFGAKRLGTRASRSSPAGEAGEAKPAGGKLRGPPLQLESNSLPGQPFISPVLNSCRCCQRSS